MIHVTRHIYRYYDPARGKTFKTRYHLTEEEAAAQLPAGATKIHESMEERDFPETAEELRAAHQVLNYPATPGREVE